MFDVVVIGGGMLGASAARHLSEMGYAIAVVAPPEPSALEDHHGPFGAHYDVSRSSRTLYVDPVEYELSKRAQKANASIEQFSQKEVFFGQGHLFVAKEEDDEEFFTHFGNSSNSHLAKIFDAEGLRKQWPELNFPPDFIGLLELDRKGMLNPRALVAAQLSAVDLFGGQIFSSAANSMKIGNHCSVTLVDGSQIEAKKVLLSTGAWSNSSGLLSRRVALKTKTEIVLLAEIDPDEAKRLKNLPVMHYEIRNNEAADIYAVPPQVYPDGKTLLKWGANTLIDRWTNDSEDINSWYRQGNSDQIIDSVKQSMENTYPGLRVQKWHTNRCVITYTPHGLPYIDALVKNKVYAAIGGNGRSAKWADPLGALAASLVAEDKWKDSLPSDRFRVIFEDEEADWVGRKLLKERNCALGGT
tara:strand:- start:273 stop:1514 length:1242 start_codon:yes stop_codon:yes gene_type:complete